VHSRQRAGIGIEYEMMVLMASGVERRGRGDGVQFSSPDVSGGGRV